MKSRMSRLSVLVLVTLAAVPAWGKSINWNNASGSGEWNTTATNWSGNQLFVDGDTVTFNINNVAGTIFIGTGGVPGSVAPGALWSGYQGTTYLTGGDISGTGTVNHGDDGGLYFRMAGGLTFSGGTFLGRTANESGVINYEPSAGGSVGFGTGPIQNSAGALGGTFNFSPTVPMTLTNRFIMTARNFSLGGNANARFTGDIRLTNNAGLSYKVRNASPNQTVYLDGTNTTVNVNNHYDANSWGLFNARVEGSDKTLNLWSASSASYATPPGGTWTDYRAGVTATNAWNVRNVYTKGGILYVDRPDLVFSLLRSNGGRVTIQNGVLGAVGGIANDTVAGTFNTGPVDYSVEPGAGGNNVARLMADVLNVTGGGTISGTGGILFGNTLNINSGSITGAVAVGGPKKADGSLYSFTTVNLYGLGLLSTTSRVNAVTLNLSGGTLGLNNSPAWPVTTRFLAGYNPVNIAASQTGNAMARTAGATALFRGANMGGSAKATFTNGTTLVDGILPWAVAETSDSGTGNSFASYDAVNGFISYPDGSYVADDLTMGDTANVNASNALSLGSGDSNWTINSLRLSSGGGVTLDAARTLTVDAGAILALSNNTGIAGGSLAMASAEAVFHTPADLTVSSAISGSNGLVKSGAGKLTLSGANALSNSATYVNAGTLLPASSTAIGTGALTVAYGSVFDMNGYDYTVAGLRDSGADLGGLVTNSSGSTKTLIVNPASGSFSFGGTIDGPIALVKSGAGSQTLIPANAYSGGTILSNGTLAVGNDNALGYGPLTIAGGTIQPANGPRTLTNALTVNGDFTIGGSANLTMTAPVQLNSANRTITFNNTGITTLSGGISESSANLNFIKAGTGALILPTNNTYSGSTTISDGVLRANDGSSLPTASLLIFNGGNSAVLETSGSFTRSIGNSAGNVKWLANGGFAAVGAPLSIQLNGGSGPLTWGSANFVPAASSLIFGSTLADNVVTFPHQLDLASGSRTIRVNDNPATTNDYVVFSGDLLNGSTPGGAILKKAGNGTLRLTGSNTFTGGVEMVDSSAYNGTIEFNSAAAMGSGTIWGNYGTWLTLKNISGGSVSLPHSFASRNNTYTIYLTGNDIVFNGTITGTGGSPSFYVATGQTNTINGAITGTPTLRSAAGYTGTFILNPAAGTTGYIPSLAGCTVGIAKDNAFGTPGAGQYTDAMQYTTLFALGGNRIINTAMRWGHNDNPTQSFIGNYNLTFTADQNTPWFNPNNGNSYFYVTAPLVTMSGVINESGFRYFHKTGTGILAFTGNNTYSMETMVEAGVFRYSGNGLSTNSFLQIKGGVVESSGLFNRVLGASAKPSSNFNWAASGGFSAFGGPLIVDVNGDGAGASPLVWNSTANFIGAATLIFGSQAADDRVTMLDNINLNAAVRTVQVNDNTASSNDIAILSGNLSGTGASGLSKTGAGTLFLNGSNSYVGATTVAAGGIGGSGSLAGSLALNTGTRFDAVIGQTLSVSNLTIATNCTLNVSNKGSGIIIAHSGTRSGEFANFTGLGSRVVKYTANDVRIESRSGTIIIIQ